MRIRDLLVVIALAGCVDNPDPRRPSVRTMEREGFGGWAVVTSTSGFMMQGELISATREYIHVLRLGQGSEPLSYLPTREVSSIRVFTYESEGGIGAFTLLGSLTAFTHGLFVIFTAPVWWISGGIAAGAESRHVIVDYPEQPLADVAMWARFPQGLPAAVDEKALITPRRLRPIIPLAPPPPTNAAPGTVTPTEAPKLNPSALFQQAKTAAASGDCRRVLEISGEIQLADAPFWDAVFAKEPSIRRCLGL